MENKNYIENQILTYLGNKRKLLNNIGLEVQNILDDLNQDKAIVLDLFSGSGIVARYLKQFSSYLYVNDLEGYSKIINECFLTNKEDFDYNYYLKLYDKLMEEIKNNPITNGLILTNYSPKDDENIQEGERAFYTNKNAIFIDSCRYYIEKIVPKDYQKFFIAPLLIEASIHTNTSGVFKGFYKDKETKIGKFGGSGENALERIKGSITLTTPVLSNYSVNHTVYQEDANNLSKKLKNIDIAYLDPPYNQHPYSSNYFMLNLILNNKLEDKISKISGIPENWNKSVYNKKSLALISLEDIVQNLDTKYFIISYNNEGFITQKEMEDMLSKYGKLKTIPIEYNAFRGSRNLKNRELKTTEFLFILKKKRE